MTRRVTDASGERQHGVLSECHRGAFGAVSEVFGKVFARMSSRLSSECHRHALGRFSRCLGGFLSECHRGCLPNVLEAVVRLLCECHRGAFGIFWQDCRVFGQVSSECHRGALGGFMRMLLSECHRRCLGMLTAPRGSSEMNVIGECWDIQARYLGRLYPE